MSATETKLDAVNAYFQQFYPADYRTNWEMEWCVGSGERRYKGEGGTSRTIFPNMVCADGFKMSVQGHFGAYSRPRGDFEDRYIAVEIMTEPPHVDALLEEFSKSEPNATYSIYGFVPVQLVCKVIENHGGLSADAALAKKGGAS